MTTTETGRPRVLPAAVFAVILDAAIYAGLGHFMIRGDGDIAGISANYAIRALAACCIAYWLMAKNRATSADLGFTADRGDVMFAAKVIGALVAGAALIIALGIVVIRLMKEKVDLGHDLPLWPVSLLCAPLAEELVYRSLLVPGLKESYGPKSVVAFSGLLFYALHLGYQRPVWHVHYFIGGAILAWAFLRRPRLWICVLLHMGGNALVMLDDLVWKFWPGLYQSLLNQPK